MQEEEEKKDENEEDDDVDEGDRGEVEIDRKGINLPIR